MPNFEAPEQESLLSIAKTRAEGFLKQGDFKGAIDSFVSDIKKDETRPEQQRDLIVMMGLELRNKTDLKEDDVREFIDGFNG